MKTAFEQSTDGSVADELKIGKKNMDKPVDNHVEWYGHFNKEIYAVWTAEECCAFSEFLKHGG